MAAYPTPHEVAVIGMSGRFPGAPDLDHFWRNVEGGIESIVRYSDDDLRESGVEPSTSARPGYVPAGAPIERIEEFDAAFFGYSPRDGETLDPQHRLFLQCAWHALEDAGYDVRRYRGAVGVFGGCAMSSYLFQLHRNPQFMAGVGFLPSLIGNDKDYLTTHVSYKLNLTGPSVTVQTACSTGLVAVTTACTSLLNHECDMALAGAATVRVPHRVGYQYVDGGIYSPDGHCRAFDAGAAGTVFGNGVGVVLLKRLEDAMRDDDDVYAVVKGFGINNDGAEKVGYTAPSVRGQCQVIVAAHEMAAVSADTISFLETHGTGTILGDPIEVEALTEAFRRSTSRTGYCAIGSVKTNVGHLDPAAGIVSFIKAVQALHHGVIPPSLHFSQANPAIDFEHSPFFVATEALPWTADGAPRRAGVSAFGIGGTNVHAVLEERPRRRRRRRRPAGAEHGHVLMLSARNTAAADRASLALGEYLASSQLAAEDVAFTLHAGRVMLPVRRAIVFRRTPEAARRLIAGEWIDSAPSETSNPPIAFMFPGQGSQHPNMGVDLYRTVPAFRQIVDQAADLLAPLLGRDIRTLLYPGNSDEDTAAVSLADTWLTQPILFTVEYALAETLVSWGIRPAALIGHSLGEYVAACQAGVFEFGQALEIVAERGRLMQDLPEGAMLAVLGDEAQVASALSDTVSVAAVNGASACVVSGPPNDVGLVESELAARGMTTQRLGTSRAFHSAMTEPILPEFARLLGEMDLNEPQIPIVSNLTGTWLTPEQATDPGYWVAQLRCPVRFDAGIGCLLDAGHRLAEVGPGHTLAALAARHASASGAFRTVTSMPIGSSEASGRDHLLTMAAALWVDGASVDWDVVHAHRGRRVHLPGYSFEPRRLWIEPAPPARGRPQRPAAATRKRVMRNWFYLPSWEQRVPDDVYSASSESPQEGWLVVGADTKLGERVVDRLRALGRPVAAVEAGAAFEPLGPGRYRIDPADGEHYRQLLAALDDEGNSCSRVVHAWTTGRLKGRRREGGFASWQELGFYSMLWLGRALVGRSSSAATVSVVAATSGVHSVVGDEPLHPAKATVLGPVKTISQEHPHIRCVNIDLDARDLAEPRLAALAERVIVEATHPGRESFLAYRRDLMFNRSYERSPLLETDRDDLFRPDGVYMITGGAGNLGLLLAEDLAACANARLALVIRTPLPPREQWRDHDVRDDPVSRTVQRLSRLEDLGSEVFVCVADLSRPNEARRAVRETVDRFGRVDGLIHASASLRREAFPVVEEATVSACELNLAAKARAIAVLADALKRQRLDFVLLPSSIAVALGGLGYAAYAAANHYLDAFAKERNRRRECRYIAVDLDQWDFVSARSDVSLLPGEGLEALHRVLASDENHVTLSVTPLDNRSGRWLGQPQTAEVADDRARQRSPSVGQASAGAAASPGPVDGARHPFATSTRRSKQAIGGLEEDVICRVWNDVLGVDDVKPQDNFFIDLGGHSLLATQAASRLRAELDLEIPLRTLFEAPTVAELGPALRALRDEGGATSRRGPIPAVSREARRIRLGDADADGVRAPVPRG